LNKVSLSGRLLVSRKSNDWLMYFTKRSNALTSITLFTCARDQYRFRRIDQRNVKRKLATKSEKEKGVERKRDTDYKGELTILYVRKLDLKSKTKISPTDLISAVLCRRACQNYVQTVANEEKSWNEIIRESERRRKLWKCDTAWIRLFLDVKGLRKGEKEGMRQRGLTR